MMANRFGRQQKRKMRAQFAAVATTNAKLSEALAMTKLVMANQLHKIMQLQGEIDRAKQIIGCHSALFAPTDLDMGEKESGFVNIPVKKGVAPDYIEWSLNAESRILNERIMFTSLDILLSDTRINYPDFGYHCMVNFGGKRWGYAANNTAIQVMTRNELVQLMANSLAGQIVHDLKKAMVR
jgi:hypothetical protein